MFPSFRDGRAIGIQSVTRRFPDRLRERGFDVVARTWRYSIDSAKLETPIERLKHPRPLLPTIDTQSARIEKLQVDSLIASLSQIRVPVHPLDASMGLDGTSFELQIGDHFCGSEFHWWSAYSGEWKPLIDWWLSAWNALADVLSIPPDQRPNPRDLCPH
jgi:hypothetical protein